LGKLIVMRQTRTRLLSDTINQIKAEETVFSIFKFPI